MNIILALRVAAARWTGGVPIGMGDSKPLQASIRSHGNNAEYVPLALVMLLLVFRALGIGLTWVLVVGLSGWALWLRRG